jgi:NDP-sugar pyrophosphorylase family protein
MNDDIKISDLFDYVPPLLSPLFSKYIFPYEVLLLLKDFLWELVSDPPEGFQKLCEGVIIGEGVEIDKSALILAPTVIEKGAKIRKDAYIRGSVFIGEGAVVGHATEVKNSILMSRAEAPHFNYVGDSILGSSAHLGAGVILSNLKGDKTDIVIHGRQDYITGRRKLGAILGDRAEIGCGSVLNPGSVIGKGSQVYPLTSFRGVLPPFHIAKGDVTVKKY